ncbi:MAG: hypothetical protein HYV90_00150 [Candidatus Woesebacteria bacterium]|nr:MAG: hypothetical protein HYV90_00150 [Candidatus Woesebacteria bacterium]
MDVDKATKREEILSHFPSSVDVNELSALLLKHHDELKEYCGKNVLPALNKFAKEQEAPQQELHDQGKYLTIRFSKDAVNLKGLPGYGDKLGVDPREIVKSLSKVWEIMNEGWGMDPYFDGSNIKALTLTRVENMTLDFDGKETVAPAFRYKVGPDGPTAEDIEKIVNVIKKGREILQGSSSTTGGLIEV